MINFFRAAFFYLQSLETSLLKAFLKNFYFPKYKKNFFLRKYMKFFYVRARKLHFPKYKFFFVFLFVCFLKNILKNFRVDFFYFLSFLYFLSLGLKVSQVAPKSTCPEVITQVSKLQPLEKNGRAIMNEE